MMPSNPSAPSRFMSLSQSYLETLLNGDRVNCRTLLDDAVGGGAEPYDRSLSSSGPPWSCSRVCTATTASASAA